MAHVLVVEDDEHIRMLIRDVLALGGHTAALAEDGKEAEEFLKQETFDLGLFDLNDILSRRQRHLLDIHLDFALQRAELPVLGVGNKGDCSTCISGASGPPDAVDIRLRILWQ